MANREPINNVIPALKFVDFAHPDYFNSYDKESQKSVRSEYKRYLKLTDKQLTKIELLAGKLGEHVEIKKGRGTSKFKILHVQLDNSETVHGEYPCKIFHYAPYSIVLEYLDAENRSDDMKLLTVYNPDKLIFLK